MATTFKGWGAAWGDSWGSVTLVPGAMRGDASFSITAGLQVNVGEMQGAASFGIYGALIAQVSLASVKETPRYSQAVKDHAHWKQLREEDDVLFALIQQFVLEEA